MPVEKLIEWENKNGPMPNHSIIFIDFGWGNKYPNKSSYFGDIDQWRFPGISNNAYDWIIKSKKIIGLSVDLASSDGGGKPMDNLYGHINLLANDIYILENVNLNYDFIPVKFEVIVLPIKLMKGSGGPCRIIAKI